MQPAPAELVGAQMPAAHLGHVPGTDVRELVEQLRHRLALDRRHMPPAVEWPEWLRIARFQDQARPRHPVRVLAMDEMAHDVERTPRLVAFIPSRPGVGEIAEKRVERGGRSTQQGERVFEMMRHTPLSYCAVCVLAACAPATPPSASHIDHVVNGLRPSIAVHDDSMVRWTLANRMQHYHVPGVSIAVIDSGKIVWARGFGVKEAGGTDSVTPTTIFQAGSISKPTFALGVMRLVQDGKLDLDQDVNAKLVSWHVPNNRFTQHEKVTLRRILSHNAGLTVHGFPGYEAGAPIPTVPQVLDGIKPANTEPVRVDTFPGAISRYSGGGTTVAMLLVTDVLHEPFAEFMRTTVLGPAGMVHSTYEQPLPTPRRPDAATGHNGQGVPVTGKYHTYPEMSAAGLWTTPSDLATLAILLQHTYAGQSSAIINQASFKQMLTVQKAPFGIGYEVKGNGPTLEFSHGGSDEGFISSFVAFAERGQGAVIMTNGDQGGNLIPEIGSAIAAEYGWPDYQQVVRSTVPVDSQRLAALAGAYHFPLPDSITLTVSANAGKLFLTLPSSDTVRLYPESDSTFFASNDGMPVAFTSAGGITVDGSFHGVKVPLHHPNDGH
jgi:CubicO group peptidase (beta-lactamase class C family)